VQTSVTPHDYITCAPYTRDILYRKIYIEIPWKARLAAGIRRKMELASKINLISQAEIGNATELIPFFFLQVC